MATDVHGLLATAAILVTTASVVGQTSRSAQAANVIQRTRLLGTVLDAQAKPVEGAVVRLYAVPVITKYATFGPPDELEIVTDQRGRFRAHILPELSYAAWASKVNKSDAGLLRVSGVVTSVGADRPLRLTLQGTMPAMLQITTTGHAAWKKYAPLSVELQHDSALALLRTAPLTADGHATIAAIPPPFRLRVLDARGVEIVRQPYSRPPSAKLEVQALAPWTTQQVGVRSIMTLKGIASATVALRTRAGLHVLGKTDQEGIATIDLPNPMGRNRLIALAPGYAAGPVQRRKCKKPPLHKGRATELHCHLGEGFEASGRLLVDGKPARGTILARVTGLHYEEQNSRYLDEFVEAIALDDQGRFQLPSCLDELPPVLDFVPPAKTRALLAGKGRSIPPVLLGLARLSKDQRDLGDIDLAKLAPLVLHLELPDGRPARGARILWIHGRGRSSLGVKAATLRADRRGRLHTLSPPYPSDIDLIIQADEAFALGRLRLGPTSGSTDVREIQIRLSPGIVIRGRVADEMQVPFGAEVRLAANRVANGIARGAHADGEDAKSSGFEPVRDAATAARLLYGHTLGFRLEPDRSFRLAVPRFQLTYSVQVGRLPAQKLVLGSEPIQDLTLHQR